MTQVEPSESVYYRFMYLTSTAEKVVGCSNRFRIRLTMALPEPPAQTATTSQSVKRSRRRVRGLSDLIRSSVDLTYM